MRHKTPNGLDEDDRIQTFCIIKGSSRRGEKKFETHNNLVMVVVVSTKLALTIKHHETR